MLPSRLSAAFLLRLDFHDGGELRMSGYLVRTKSGDKGPFDLIRLQEWVAAGKLPITARVIDAGSGLSVVLEDLLSAPGGLSTEALDAEPSEPPVAPRPSRTPPRRGARGGSTGRSHRGDSPGASRGARGASATHRRRSARLIRSKRSAAPIVLILLAVVAIGGGGAYALRQRTDQPLLGRWVMDPASTLDVLRATPEYQSMQPAQRELAEGMLQGMAATVEFTFRESELTARIGDVKEDGPYRVASRNGNHYAVEILDRDGSVAERIEFEIQGRRMLMQGRGESVGRTASVLVKK